MSSKILVVEDEIFIAMAFEDLLHDLGHEPIGIAPDSRRAMALASEAELAFVDLNLADGPTGVEVGRALADRGVTVIYMTANPEQLGDGVPGTIGVIPKPADNNELRQAVEYAIAVRRRHQADARPPLRLKLFDGLGARAAVA